MMKLITLMFTWWNRQTLGTRLFTWRKGEAVGEDGHGNTYYRTRDDSKRWVIFRGETEASAVPPEWHGWLHHTFETPPSEAAMARHGWELPHRENMTGTGEAYHPPGSMYADGPGPGPGYEAWKPE